MINLECCPAQARCDISIIIYLFWIIIHKVGTIGKRPSLRNWLSTYPSDRHPVVVALTLFIIGKPPSGSALNSATISMGWVTISFQLIRLFTLDSNTQHRTCPSHAIYAGYSRRLIHSPSCSGGFWALCLPCQHLNERM